MSDLEIEIKVQIENSQPLVNFLQSQATFKGESHQVDEYYSPAHRDFIAERPVKEWLRLRAETGSCSITYKQWHYNEHGKSTHCDEYESKLDNIDQCRKIFTVLNFKNLTTVDKFRRTWQYENYEIALDTVRNLGDFVEIEFTGDTKDADPKKITEQITNEMMLFLENLSCGKIERNHVGYPFLLLFPEKKF